MSSMSKKTLESTSASIGATPFKMIVHSHGHTIIADEPASSGGADLGMNPFSLLLGGLATCTASTLKIYAERHQWPLKEANVTVDMEEVKGIEVKYINIIKSVELHGDLLTEDQRKKLMEIAARCPVHKILTGKITIDTIMFSEKNSVS